MAAADILRDPLEAVKATNMSLRKFLRGTRYRGQGVLPCGDTGTAIIVGKANAIWTGGGDEAALARGVYNTISKITCAIRKRGAGYVQRGQYRY